MENRMANVLPSKQTMLSLRTRLNSARMGHSLLKKKAQALTQRHRTVMRQIGECKERLGTTMTEAFFSLASATRVAGDVSAAAIAGAPATPSVGILSRVENIAGVELPTLSTAATGASRPSDLGLARGGAEVDAAGNAFRAALDVAVELAALQSTYVRLEAVIRTVNRRVNALEFVLIPQLEATVAWIKTELMQNELDDTARLKNVRDIIKRQQAAAEAAAEAARLRGVEIPEMPLETAIGNVEDEDEDVFF